MQLLIFGLFGPITFSILVITVGFASVCWIRGANRVAITAILLSMLAHTANIHFIQVPIGHLAIDIATGIVVVRATHASDKLYHATFWNIVVGVQMVVLFLPATIFWGGVITKGIKLASIILCLPPGGGSRVGTDDTRNRPYLWNHPRLGISYRGIRGQLGRAAHHAITRLSRRLG